MTSLKTSITYLSDTGCLEIQRASLKSLMKLRSCVRGYTYRKGMLIGMAV